jgi:hypothetical protein
MRKNQRGISVLHIVWAVAGILVIAAGSWQLAGNWRDTSTEFSTPYQAVLLSNGSVYFGHLHGYGGRQPMLTEVYYVVTQSNPDTKQTNNVLVKRGKELHEPDRMYLNPSQIILVEPVGTGSKVAQLIAQQK